jgi:hypothetical protein
MKFTLDAAVLVVAGAVLGFFRNWQAALFFVLALAYSLVRYYKAKKSNEFLINDISGSLSTAELDAGLDYRPMPNHFRTYSLFDTSESKSLYEYRIEGTDVLCRLIKDWHRDIDVPEHQNVRDGVVLESELRKRDAERPNPYTDDVENRIADLKNGTQWHKMESSAFLGLKYFIIAKKLPKSDARRYLRQELERLKTGEARFFKEAEKLGLERDDDSTFVARLKVADGKAKPPDEEIRKLFDSTESLGITDVEFGWGQKLIGVLDKLLGD